ncbi:unnamed protein product [Cyclocybe aegerita]|uniref:AIG1-type G domain-containing protein n=1 Tax=Cyclocybe aegerita TaxID=1973307 RepID=A0A8S0XPV9_CYCAE|nr:unnamed protein product [Cyclocybe aegerita]
MSALISHSRGTKDPDKQMNLDIIRLRGTNISDNVLKDGRETDIVIPVMGPTGAGKSTFINIVLGKDQLQVGHSVNSSTVQLAPVVVDLAAHSSEPAESRLILVDTPGFDDTFVDDVEILRQIANWLAASYRRRMPIGGVLYLHDISLKRFTGTARRNLEMFRRLCGQDALPKVIVVTTSWNLDTLESRERREVQMKSIHWKPMMDAGAEVRRFDGTYGSAWEIVNVFLQRAANTRRDAHLRRIVPLQIQRELVDFKLCIPQTDAGKVLLSTLEEALQAHKTIPALEEAAEAGDPKAKEKLDELQAKIRDLQRQMQALKISLPQRILQWFRILQQ